MNKGAPLLRLSVEVKGGYLCVVRGVRGIRREMKGIET